MNYTVATLKTIKIADHRFYLSIQSNGTICYAKEITDEETGEEISENTFVKFESVRDAYPIYERLTQTLILGTSTHEERKESLLNKTPLLSEKEKRENLNARLKKLGLS
jgi:hypothetical protein